jgi:hypothetical protein
MPTIATRGRKNFATLNPDEYVGGGGTQLISNSTYIQRMGKLVEESQETQELNKISLYETPRTSTKKILNFNN